MKKLYIIGGTMGVGKTTTCESLLKKLPQSVFLDGDWCWKMNPFVVNDETKEMVLKNISFLLNSFIQCSCCQNIIFCWVLDHQSIIDSILSTINTDNVETISVSLIADESALSKRLRKDINSGIRSADIIKRSIERLPLYNDINSIKINVSDITPEDVSDKILNL